MTAVKFSLKIENKQMNGNRNIGFILGSMSVGLNILIRHSFMDL